MEREEGREEEGARAFFALVPLLLFSFLFLFFFFFLAVFFFPSGERDMREAEAERVLWYAAFFCLLSLGECL